MKRKLMQVFAFIMAFILFISCPLSVYASEKWEGSLGLTLYYNKDKILQYFKDTGEFWLYGASQLGAIVKSDFVSFAENKKKMDDILSEGNKIGVYVDENDNAKGMFFSKEFMAELKALIEQYAKENEPYYIVPVASYKDIDPSQFSSKAKYNTLCNLAKKYKLIGVNGHSADMTVTDLSDFYKDGCSIVFTRSYFSTTWQSTEYWGNIYNSDWSRKDYYYYSFTFDADDVGVGGYTSLEEGRYALDGGFSEVRHTEFCVNYPLCYGGKIRNDTATISAVRLPCLVSDTGGRMRVYRTVDDFKQYSVGKRSVYYTTNYYNYVPEDLSVSIDDLQKEIDDLSKVIDELLKQIQDNTDESEIEELLGQILEALKNQQGGGGGTGGGDVNVDIDLSTTNGLLSKILAKVTQIFEKMNAVVEDAESAAMAKIQESLDEIIVQLKKIKRWTAVDTVIDGVDAIADWLDLIRGVLKDAEEGAGSAVATIASAVGDSVDTMSRKFPFSIPWDILFFVSVLSAEPQVPHFEIPFNIELSMLDITIDYTMELDFTQLQWLSDLSRLLLSMTYAVGLMRMTFGVTSAGKEE